MKKKLLMTLFLGAFSLALMTGCGSKKTDENDNQDDASIWVEINDDDSYDDSVDNVNNSDSADDILHAPELFESLKDYPQPAETPMMTIMDSSAFTGAPVTLESIAEHADTISYLCKTYELDKDGYYSKTDERKIENVPASELLSLEGQIFSGKSVSVEVYSSDSKYYEYLTIFNFSDDCLPASECVANNWWSTDSYMGDYGTYESIANTIGAGPVDSSDGQNWALLIERMTERFGPAEHIYLTGDLGDTKVYTMFFEIEDYVIQIRFWDYSSVGVYGIDEFAYYPIEFLDEHLQDLESEAGYDANVFEKIEF